MVATNLLTATLKFARNITVQIQGDGPLRLALSKWYDQRNQIRAPPPPPLLEWCNITENMSLHDYDW